MPYKSKLVSSDWQLVAHPAVHIWRAKPHSIRQFADSGGSVGRQIRSDTELMNSRTFNFNSSLTLLVSVKARSLQLKSQLEMLFNPSQQSTWRYLSNQSSSLTGRAQVSPLCPSGKGNVYIKIIAEHWWNDDRRQSKYSEKNVNQWHFIHHKTHTDCPGIEPRPPQWKSGRLAAWTMAGTLKTKKTWPIH